MLRADAIRPYEGIRKCLREFVGATCVRLLTYKERLGETDCHASVRYFSQ